MTSSPRTPPPPAIAQPRSSVGQHAGVAHGPSGSGASWEMRMAAALRRARIPCAPRSLRTRRLAPMVRSEKDREGHVRQKLREELR
jgi:hypothetical protein